MTDLITRIEATPADATAAELRKLSDDGLLMLGWGNNEYHSWYNPDGIFLQHGSLRPNPAASMDDCLRQVPEGCWTREVHQGQTQWRWQLGTGQDHPHFTETGRASTPALALWAAILKAASHDQ